MTLTGGPSRSSGSASSGLSSSGPASADPAAEDAGRIVTEAPSCDATANLPHAKAGHLSSNAAKERSCDAATAQAFASSWNNLPAGSVYTREQVQDWFAPLTAQDFSGKRVLELGCGNGSLLTHAIRFQPARLVGVDLGASLHSARRNMEDTGLGGWELEQADLCAYTSDGFDLVYCIGVLHHLREPDRGFASVVANTRPGGRFHCWVYAHEGNALVRHLVDPLRRIASRLPWWFTKYALATPLVVPFYFYAKLLALLPSRLDAHLPLGAYARWISAREFAFFRHVAFDQLVTPQTVYLRREQVEAWLRTDPRIDPDSTYIRLRNGNSWIFGGRRLPA